MICGSRTEVRLLFCVGGSWGVDSWAGLASGLACRADWLAGRVGQFRRGEGSGCPMTSSREAFLRAIGESLPLRGLNYPGTRSRAPTAGRIGQFRRGEGSGCPMTSSREAFSRAVGEFAPLARYNCPFFFRFPGFCKFVGEFRHQKPDNYPLGLPSVTVCTFFGKFQPLTSSNCPVTLNCSELLTRYYLRKNRQPPERLPVLCTIYTRFKILNCLLTSLLLFQIHPGSLWTVPGSGG